jgi:hypothetical protein
MLAEDAEIAVRVEEQAPLHSEQIVGGVSGVAGRYGSIQDNTRYELSSRSFNTLPSSKGESKRASAEE